MKLAIVGSRSFDDYKLMEKELLPLIGSIDTIISGGAKGADSLAERFADNYFIPTIIFKPDWNKFGKRAGFIRNKDIINNADKVIAFWDRKSRGTSNSIDLAISQNKLLKIIEF
jgi:hypothetical protein